MPTLYAICLNVENRHGTETAAEAPTGVWHDDRDLLEIRAADFQGDLQRIAGQKLKIFANTNPRDPRSGFQKDNMQYVRQDGGKYLFRPWLGQ